MSGDDPDLVRYWFEFDLTGLEPPSYSPGTVSLDGGTLAHRFCWKGVGITGFDEADCLTLLADVLAPEAVPPVRTSTRNVDVSSLDLEPRWVGTAIVPVWRGVWFPPQNAGGPVLQ